MRFLRHFAISLFWIIGLTAMLNAQDYDQITDEQKQKALQQTIERLRGDNEHHRRTAADAISYYGADAADAIPDLHRWLLETSDVDMQRYSAKALGSMGKAAVKTIPDLLIASKDSDSILRTEAVKALGLISPEDDTVIERCIAALNDESVYVRRSAILSLSLSQKALPRLVNLVDDSNERIRALAIETLARAGERAVPTLLAALESTDQSKRIAAASAAGRFWGQAKLDTFANFYPYFNDRDVKVKTAMGSAAVHCILLGSPEAKAATIANFRTDDEAVLEWCIDLAGPFHAANSECSKFILQGIQHKDANVRSNFVRVLGLASPTKEEHLKILVDLIDDKDCSVRVMEALFRVTGANDPYRKLVSKKWGEPTKERPYPGFKDDTVICHRTFWSDGTPRNTNQAISATRRILEHGLLEGRTQETITKVFGKPYKIDENGVYLYNFNTDWQTLEFELFFDADRVKKVKFRRIGCG